MTNLGRHSIDSFMRTALFKTYAEVLIIEKDSSNYQPENSVSDFL